MPRKPQKKCYSQRRKGRPFLKGYNIHHDPTDPATAVDTEDPSTSETTKTTGPKRPVGRPPAKTKANPTSNDENPIAVALGELSVPLGFPQALDWAQGKLELLIRLRKKWKKQNRSGWRQMNTS